MKVWGFNCFGVCIKRIDVNKIDEYNKNHLLVRDRIAYWRA